MAAKISHMKISFKSINELLTSFTEFSLWVSLYLIDDMKVKKKSNFTFFIYLFSNIKGRYLLHHVGAFTIHVSR